MDKTSEQLEILSIIKAIKSSIEYSRGVLDDALKSEMLNECDVTQSVQTVQDSLKGIQKNLDGWKGLILKINEKPVEEKKDLNFHFQQTESLISKLHEKVVEKFHWKKIAPMQNPDQCADIPEYNFPSFILIKDVWSVRRQIPDVARDWPANVDSCKVEPALPRGLSFRAYEDGINGSPKEISDATQYKLTAEYKGKCVFKTRFVIQVAESHHSGIPDSFENGLRWTLAKNAPFAGINVTHLLRNNNPLWYAIYPDMGNGLKFDIKTGTIFGTPEKAAQLKKYTIESCGVGDRSIHKDHCTRNIDIEIIVI